MSISIIAENTAPVNVEAEEARLRELIREEVRRGGWTKLPNWVIENPSLSPAEFRVLAYVKSWDWGKDPYCSDAQPEIAEKLALSERTVWEALKKLEADGWITSEASGWKQKVRGKTQVGQTKRYQTSYFKLN